jgi:hypothetical protein
MADKTTKPDLSKAAQDLIAAIRKWKLDEGTLEPRSSAARFAYQEVSSAFISLFCAVDRTQGNSPWGSVSQDDYDAARSILFDVATCDLFGDKIGGGFEWGDAHPVKIDPIIISRLEHAISLLGTSPEPAANPPKKRHRSKKQDVVLKTQAAIVYKAEHPEATEEECAAKATIPRTTLAGQPTWIEWVPKIEQASATGKLIGLRAELDKRTGELVATEVDQDEQ